jgi:hypothetical protein
MIPNHRASPGASALAFTLAFVFATPEAPAQNGPITSRLTTARFVLMKGWWGSDHNATTPTTFKYIATLAASRGIQMDTVNLTGQGMSPAALSKANLDNYDVMMWYNVYRMYHNMDTATRNRVQTWYDNGNKGLGCYHQCVRESDDSVASGNKWNWWRDMMAQPYTIYAGQGSGPVYFDSQAVATVYGNRFAARDSVTINDEFYGYAGVVRGTPGTKMLLTTKRSMLPTGWNMPAGEDKPMVWLREYRGGRYVMSGLFHTSEVTTATGTLRAFYDSTLIGTMRFMAGYNGCKDSNYVEYNPRATHQQPNACMTPTFLRVGRAGGAGDPAGGIRMEDFRIVFTQPGLHSVEVFNTSGAKVASRRGEGNGEYRFSDIRKPGVYYVRVVTAGMAVPYSRRIVLL